MVQDLWAVLAQTGQVWWRACTLQPQGLGFLHRADTWPVLILLAVGASISGVMGRIVVLAVNRFPRRLVAAGVLVSAARLVGSYVVEGLCLWMLSRAFFGGDASFVDVWKAIMLSAAPLWCGFLAAIPLLGPLIEKLLHTWSFVVLWVVVQHFFGISPLSAVFFAGASWLALLIVHMVMGRPLSKLGDWWYKRATGRSLRPSASYLLHMPWFESAKEQP